jgi:glyoxylase-like metal-dependent hydrolase (beta-lactamase superfamily II)
MPQTLFYQLFEPETSTYTYIVADPVSKEGVIIDPVLENCERDLKLIGELGINLKYVLDTHIHADHITGAGKIRSLTKAQTAVSKGAKVDCVDISLQDQQTLQFGNLTLKALATPGHTDSCMSFLINDKVFTGDCLMIRSAGRTDFQQGSSDRLYESVHQKLFTLPDHFEIYPAHDYKGHTKSTIIQEKLFNPRLKLANSKETFSKIMSELNLAEPKKINEAVPANLQCGRGVQNVG